MGRRSSAGRGAQHPWKAEAVADLIRHGVHERNLNPLLSLLAAHVVDVLGADFSTVTLVDEHDVALVRGSHGVISDAWTKHTQSRRTGTTARTLAAGHTIAFDDISDRSQYPGSRFTRNGAEGPAPYLRLQYRFVMV